VNIRQFQANQNVITSESNLLQEAPSWRLTIGSGTCALQGILAPRLARAQQFVRKDGLFRRMFFGRRVSNSLE
jgi:hypothetical protein